MNNTEQYTTIPTVKGIPLLGTIPKLLGNDSMAYLKNFMLKHGDMVKLYLDTTPIYLASSPELLQQVFRDKYPNYREPGFVYDTCSQENTSLLW
jgi:hypothetical protein